MSNCQGCGVALALTRRKWCSERCRKSQYSAACARCGALMTGTNGRGPNAPTLCHDCRDLVSGARQRERGEKIAQQVVALWGAGRTSTEIAAEMGWKVFAMRSYISQLRQRGYDIPHRRAAHIVEDARTLGSRAHDPVDGWLPARAA